MARGGGTGSRNKKKKSAEAPATNQNGAVEHQKSVPEAAGADSKQSKNTKHRKQKEETPPVVPPEDEQKESQTSKLVPTSEQLRLAQITQSADTNMDPQRKAKISQVMDITGKSEDEVATALFDCAWDETKAIELLLEEGGLGSWETTGQKKKKKAEKEEPGKENEDWNEDFDPNNQFSDNRERSRNRGPPRLRNRGGSSVQGGGREDQWKSREFQENERNFEGGRGRGGRGMGPRSRGGGQGGMPPRQRGRGGGPRGFSNRGEFGERGERAERPTGEAGGLGQIDTWNPIGQEQQDQRQRHHKLQNKDAFDNAGNWGDDFPTAEDWDNDEYTGSLSDTKVFTPSGSSAKAVGEPVNGSVSHPAAVGTGAAIGSAAQPTPANNSLGTAYSQPIDLSTLLKPGGLAPPSAAPGGPTGHSQYNQTATQDLKSAIGIGGKSGEQLAPGYGSSSLSYSSGTGGGPSPYTSTTSHQQSSFNNPAPGSAFSPIKPAAVTNGSSGGSKALPRARLPPPSKIPSSAVEMPGAGDSLSNLDVQFGGLDLQFGGSNNDSNSSNFDFNAAPGPGVSSTPPGPAKDSLDSKYVHSIQSGAKGEPAPPLDSYKAPGQPSLAPGAVKDVNQSLSSALSAAGIKPSSSTDSVPGYGREGPTRPDSKSNPGYGVPGSAQRSPGPLITKAETLGYTSPAYPYQSSNPAQSGKGAGYPGYPSNQTYERQNSSGYSSSNGLSSSYGGGSGGTSSYNSGAPGSNSSGYSANNASYSNTQQATNNFNSGYGNAATTNYSPYTSNNSYSSKSGAPSSTSYIPTSATSTSLSQYSNSQDSSISTSTSKSSYDTATVSAPGYGTVPTTGLGLSASMVGGQSVSSASKMSVNTTSGKMVPGMPPGVASVLPAQYMIGANAAAAGFPAYLAAAGLGQAPAMYGYGGHQLEDLAALQRSTLAASLPQLVGTAATQGQGGNNQAQTKGPSTGYYDPSSQFGGAGVPSTLASRQDQQSSFGGDSSKFGGGVSDSTSSPVPTSVANAGQPTPFNALASTFAAAAPQQHPTLPPGYAYFYGGVGGMPGALQAYGGGVGGGVYPATHPGIPVPTAAGATNTSQFQNKAYGASSYGTSYDSLNLGQSNSGYGKNNYGSDTNQAKSGTSSSNAGHGYWSNALW